MIRDVRHAFSETGGLTVLYGNLAPGSCVLKSAGATSGLSIGHISPEAASGGLIALVEEGDPINISLRYCSLDLLVEAEEIARRSDAMRARGGGRRNALEVMEPDMRRHARARGGGLATRGAGARGLDRAAHLWIDGQLG